MSGSDTQAGRRRHHGQPARSQGSRRAGDDRSGGRDAALSSSVLTGPQPDRAGLQQIEGAPTKGGRDDCPRPLAQDRSASGHLQSTRMQKLLAPCGLCSNLIGIRSNQILKGSANQSGTSEKARKTRNNVWASLDVQGFKAKHKSKH